MGNTNREEQLIESQAETFYDVPSLFSESDILICEDCGKEVATHEWYREKLCQKCVNKTLKKLHKMEIMELLADDYIDDMICDGESEIYAEFGIEEV